MSRERELLTKALRYFHKNHLDYDFIAEIEAELAKPEDSGMTALDIQDDDALRFIQRVLESDAPEEDRNAARDKIVEIRTRVRKFAEPEGEPTDFVVIDENGLHIYSSSIKQFCHDHINSALDDDSLFEYAKTWKVKSLFESPRPMQRLTNEEISDLIDDHWEGDNEAHFINAIMDAMIEKNK